MITVPGPSVGLGSVLKAGAATKPTGSGKVRVRDFAFTRMIDKASPIL